MLAQPWIPLPGMHRTTGRVENCSRLACYTRHTWRRKEIPCKSQVAMRNVGFGEQTCQFAHWTTPCKDVKLVWGLVMQVVLVIHKRPITKILNQYTIKWMLITPTTAIGRISQQIAEMEICLIRVSLQIQCICQPCFQCRVHCKTRIQHAVLSHVSTS